MNYLNKRENSREQYLNLEIKLNPTVNYNRQATGNETVNYCRQGPGRHASQATDEVGSLKLARNRAGRADTRTAPSRPMGTDQPSKDFFGGRKCLSAFFLSAFFLSAFFLSAFSLRRCSPSQRASQLHRPCCECAGPQPFVYFSVRSTLPFISTIQIINYNHNCNGLVLPLRKSLPFGRTC